MRIDLFLKRCCLVKRRSWAKAACEKGIVAVDGRPVKPSKEVTLGQTISLTFADRYLEIEILDLPRGNIPKAFAKQFYRVIRDKQTGPADFL